MDSGEVGGGGLLVPTPTFSQGCLCFTMKNQTSLETCTCGPRFQARRLKIGSLPDILDIHCNTIDQLLLLSLN